ncbi:GTPase [Acinetobacter soli]|uniref:GTPase n=1 Tax=Acinetobacter soli TaxID=487316 RepID=UPI00300C07CD
MKHNDYLDDSFDVETGEFNIEKAKKSIFERKEKINILLMGASGVGKSQLINTFFGIPVAKTGDGSPQTQRLQKFTYDAKGLILWDTKGIEAADYQNTLTDLRIALESAKLRAVSSKSLDELPHIAWLCIKETSKRIEEREIELVKLVSEYNIPVIVVFTQTQFENGDAFVKEAKTIFNDAGCLSAIKNRYVRINSIAYTMMGGAVNIPVSGLDSLFELTEDAFPEGSKNAKKAFEKAQAVNAEKKLEAILDSCNTKIHIAAVAAGTAGASPIPGSDAPIIAAIQSMLINTINSEFELDDEFKNSVTVITGILGVTALAQVGKSIVSNALKFIPFAGSLIGGAISAATAVALTEALGHAYVKTLTSYYDKNESKVILPENTQEIIDIFTGLFNPLKKRA